MGEIKSDTDNTSVEFMHMLEDDVRHMHEKMPAEEMLFDLAELFKIFGDTTRIKILFALLESEMCVFDIALMLGMTQSSISHQLRVLKTNGLVKFRREGKVLFYSLSDSHITSILSQGMEHIAE